MNNIDFDGNELIAIYSALKMQIAESIDYMNDPDISFAEKNNVNQMLAFSKTALNKLQKVFDKNNIKPFRT